LWEEVMRFGKRALAVRLLLLVLGAITLAVPTFAQTRNRDVGANVFRSFGVGSEIGVSVRELSSEEISKVRLERAGGVYVQNVREESPASRSGIRSGDIIVSVDGERVRGVNHFARLVSESPAGRAVRTEIVRETARQVIEVTPVASEHFALLPEIREELERRLRTLPRDLELELPALRTSRTRLGMTMMSLTDQLATYFGVKEGVLVSSVEAGSPASEAGIRAGDVITAVDGRAVRSQIDVVTAARNAARGSILDVRLVRDRKEVALKIVIPDQRPDGSRQIPI
jgi:serine protease Do